jgi:hypothetical protein
MKKAMILTFAVGIVTLMGSLQAIAQGVQATFTMPSSFYAGSAKLPAGTYTLRQMQDDTNAFVLENSAGTHSVILEGRPSTKASKGGTDILFNRYGDAEYLEGIATSNRTSVDLVTGIAEKIAAKKGTAQPHTVPAK